MKRGQLAILVFAALAVGLIAFAGGGRRRRRRRERQRRRTATRRRRRPPGALRVTFPYSPEKEKLLEPLIERFNASKTEVGRQGRLRRGRDRESSGVTEQRIAQGRDKPVAWSPASSLWGRLLNFEADQPLVPDENPSIVRTPLVIAMWEPMAKALGYPEQAARLRRHPQARAVQGGLGATTGCPEYGAFKLVHTNPDFSTAGLSAVVAEYYAATGKKEGLRPEDVTGKAREKVRAIERSIVHYGDTTLFIADQMRKGGLGYASAVAMEEATLLDFNRDRGAARCRSSSRSIPKEGTFFSDSPFIVLDARLGHAGAARGRAGVPALPGRRRSRPRSPPRGGFRPADLEAKPGRPDHGRQRRRPRRSPSACWGCPSRACWRCSSAPGARTASPPTCCSCSTRRAR